MRAEEQRRAISANVYRHIEASARADLDAALRQAVRRGRWWEDSDSDLDGLEDEYRFFAEERRRLFGFFRSHTRGASRA